MTKLTSISTICLATAMFAMVPPLHAEPSAVEAAKAHADRGTMYYNLSDWTAAIREYRAAFEADPRPEYLFAKGQAERQSGDCGAAISSYKAFLRTSNGSSARIAATESLIRECEAKVEDARSAEKARRLERLEESRRLEETRRLEEKRKFERDLGDGDERSDGVARPEVAASQPAARPNNGSWISDPAGLILSAGGVLVAGVGGALFFVGNSGVKNASNQSTYRLYESHVSTSKTVRTAGIVGMGVGAALLSLGIVRYVIVVSHHKSVVTQLGVGPDGVLIHGQF